MVERCPDKTEALGPIPSTRTMGFEGFPTPEPVSPEVFKRANSVLTAKNIWESLEKNEEPSALESDQDVVELIEALEFLKDKNKLEYSPEEKKAQNQKIDVYIESLKEVK